jgi:hypothetical protein
MKIAFSLVLLSTSFGLMAQTISLAEYGNWPVTDIAEQGLSKERLFTRMDTRLVKTKSSICSNRALIWVYDFKRFFNINAAKIFLFYTKKTGDVGRKTWWYHVSPMVNENGRLWVMDAGFPKYIDSPLSQEAWLEKFVGSSNCKEIKLGENDLIERMFAGRVFPERTQYGTFDCYYRVTPAGYWTPASIAQNLLGVDETGTPVHHVRDDIDTDELMQACVEASTNPVGRWLGDPKKNCQKYLGLR